MHSLAFLRKHNLAWFLWFPFGITLLVFILGFSLTSWATDIMLELLQSWMVDLNWQGQWVEILQEVFYWVLWILLRVLLYFAFAFIGGSVILILMAPILTWLSERVAVKLGSDVAPFSWKQFRRDLARAFGLTIRNGLIQLVLTFVCFLVGFIPILGIASPFLIFGVNAYYYGYSFMDFTLERKKYSVTESNAWVWDHKATTLSLGAPFALWMLVPFIGPMTGGFMAIFATVAATEVLES